MAVIAKLSVALTANTRRFVRDLNKANAGIKGFAKSVGSLALGVAKLGAALTAITAGAFTFAIKKQFEFVDQTGKLARQLGTTTEELTGLQLAARLSGTSVAVLNKSIQRMTRSVGEFKINLGASVVAFEQLGIGIMDIERLDAAGQFKLIAQRLKELESASQRNAVAAAIFGRAGQELLVTLNEGVDGLNRIKKANEELGGSFSNIDASRIEDANDRIQELVISFQSVARNVAIGIAPLVSNIAAALTEGFGNLRTDALPLIGDFIRRSIPMFRDFAIRSVTPIFQVMKTLAQFVFTVGQQVSIAVGNVAKFLTSLGASLTSGLLGINQFGDSFKEMLILIDFGAKNIEEFKSLIGDELALAFFQARDAANLFFADLGSGLIAADANIGVFLSNARKLSDAVSKSFQKTIIDTLFFRTPPSILTPLVAMNNLIDSVKEAGKAREAFVKSGDVKGLLGVLSISPETLTAQARVDAARSKLRKNFKDFRIGALKDLEDFSKKAQKIIVDLFNFDKIPNVTPFKNLLGTFGGLPGAFRQQQQSLQAVRQGTVEAFKAERRQDNPVTRGLRAIVTEVEKTNARLQQIERNTKFRPNIVRLPGPGIRGGVFSQ